MKMTCDICTENKNSEIMPCCKGKRICTRCLVALPKKKYPFCQRGIELRKKQNKQVRRCSCVEFWCTIYHISYIIFQLGGIALASYDLYMNNDSPDHMADNIIAIIIIALVFTWYVNNVDDRKGDICTMAVAGWGMPWVMGQQLIWTSFYVSPLNGHFMASSFAAWLVLGALVVVFWILFGLWALIRICYKSLSNICKDCGHLEEREDPGIDIHVNDIV